MLDSSVIEGRSRAATSSVTGPIAIGSLAGSLSLAYLWLLPRPLTSDFSIAWACARFLVTGVNPYTAIGPGLAHDFPWPFLYPVPACVIALPVAWLPMTIADAVFSGVSAALLWYALALRGVWPQRLVFLSIGYWLAIHVTQWTPLLTAAALIPSLGFLLAAKPSIGAALFLAYPSWRALAGGILIVCASFVLMPTWPQHWWATLQGNTLHISAPILRPGGIVLLAALIAWRRADARLLLALACIPHNAELYEAVPLFLLVRTPMEGFSLMALSVAVQAIWIQMKPFPSYEAQIAARGLLMLWLVYVPCLVMVLRRSHVAVPRATAQRRGWVRNG